MSLFKTRDWWVSDVGDGSSSSDECATGSLLTARLNPETPKDCQVIVGTHSGKLNIYTPQTTLNEDEEEISGYLPEHLLLETELNYPILQLLSGTLIGSGIDYEQLCVLHPQRVVVYSIVLIDGIAKPRSAGSTSTNTNSTQGLQVKLTPAYQHVFRRQAYSAIVGSFGSVKGKDFICIQSLDGCLSVYEQESMAFQVFLPGALLAGPLLYLPKTDAIATVSASCNLQVYKYQNLAVWRSEENEEGGKRLMWDWEQIVGEEPLDMQLVGVHPLSTLLLLTTRGFYGFKDTGTLKYVKKLEGSPACFTAFAIGASQLVCVATHSQTLLVYNETVLKWTAQLPFVPVAIKRADFKGIKGSLVLLSPSGKLQIVYLGTDPSLFAAPPIEAREIDYEQTDKELAHLHKVIKSSTKDSSSVISNDRLDAQLLSVSASVGQKLEPWTGATSIQDPDGHIPCCTAVIRLTAQQPINAVRVAICVAKPLAVSQSVFMLRSIGDSSQLLVKFYLSAAYVACSLTAEVVTSYTSDRGVPRVIRTMLELPLRLVVKTASPNKEAEHKITLSTNKSAVNLPELFPEFGLDSSLSSTGMGLQHYSGPLVTVLSSRTTHRYRLQSDSLAALWVVFREMCQRLRSYWSTGGQQGSGFEALKLSVSSSLPVNELFSLIDAHFLRRKKHANLNEQLVQRCLQVRAVQRRLLTKFKDKNPTPLTNLDNLLDGMYKQVLHITDLIQDNTSSLELCSSQLSCVIQLVVELMKLHHNASDSELFTAALTHYFPPPPYTQGWEEVIDCNVSYLLRTVFSKSDSQNTLSQTPLAPPSDTTKLKKHISLLLDKLTRGGDQSMKQPNDNLDEADVNTDPVEVPMGSKLGEDRVRSARIRSARLQSARSIASRLPVIPDSENSEDNPQVVVEEDDNNPQIVVEEGNSPFEAAIQELKSIQSSEEVQELAVKADTDKPTEPIKDTIDEESGLQMKAATKEETAKNDRSFSAKYDGKGIEAPTLDIFGNPEEEELW